ncbi:carboxypeptidase M32 [Aliivibrio fischeri]|uniref:carboxypeptidase M32 n=1 Tax=Aliivibrio fischeri TaxID=668 RepID=UPI0016693A5F|nr:carboxypeptidase M32 [Aliivibrio fischeri]USR94428.1 carboxypeptidase M32 [Aliivibrio fischeri ATCC 7744 = JCM 18803 = DSM 507]GGK25263.1 carboxypeptidase M32 [Aliivibrio fischeri]
MSHYQKLVAHSLKISRFEHLSAICGWDQAAVMPSGGNDARSEAMAELSVHLHKLGTEPQLAEWFDKAESESLSDNEQASLREMKSKWQQTTALPETLVEAQSLAGSKCEHAWRSQRSENDWDGFSKNFAEVVALSQEEAQIRAEITGLTPYDAMLDLYEPGTTTAKLDVVFNDVKSWLPALIQNIQEKQATESIYLPQGHYPTEQQRQLSLDVMKFLNFDFNHGRLDVSMHPFCGGVPTDVRITTRYDENDFVQSLMGTVHETGHARYEQGLPKEFAGLAVGEARSMGIHESQSLFFEMQLSRSAEFISQLSPLVQKNFVNADQKIFETDNLQKIYTRVKPDFIRVDADEATYPAHVILRYEIERDLMNGNISYKDIPELWDAKIQQYLGLTTKGNYKNGCMQDIHWTDGSFGYFPSYTLGAMYAAQFMAAMKQTVDVEKATLSGDLSPIFTWLSDNIWTKASLFSTDDLVKQATGDVLNASFFKAHLEKRYLG